MPGGTVTVAGERIRAVKRHGQRLADLDLGNAAIIPGFVNAHTHLDLSGLRGRCPPTHDFTEWLREVIRHRRSRTTEQIEADVRAGLAECIASGTTLIADVSAGGLSWPVLADAPVRSIVFYEMLGLTKERADRALAEAEAWLASHPATPTCRPGLSPHAPYSVRAELFKKAARLAREYDCPLAVHLAETQAELELLAHRTGPFVPFLRELGVWDPDGLVHSIDEVLQGCAGPGIKLFIHGNYLQGNYPAWSSHDPETSTVVYCPRTHAAFGHPPHPSRDLSRCGFALGTDSLASNPGLDMLGEMRCFRERKPDLGSAVPLSEATLFGAYHLGRGKEVGMLYRGWSADLVVLDLPDEEPADPHELLYHSATRVRAVLCRGRWVHGDLPAPP
jgi:cytosine/adenosine deaminase-related metal-dependent hydrolase